MSCPPTKMPPGYFSRLSPCDQLALYEEAAFALASGDKRKVVRHGEHWVEFQAVNFGFIERQISRLRALCGASTGAGGRTAITIARTPSGPPRRY